MSEEKTWYHYWNKETKEYVGVTSNLIGSESYIHQKIKAPKCPLEDGWYLVKYQSGCIEVLREKRGDAAYGIDGDIRDAWEQYKILKKVTMEDVDE